MYKPPEKLAETKGGGGFPGGWFDIFSLLLFQGHGFSHRERRGAAAATTELRSWRCFRKRFIVLFSSG